MAALLRCGHLRFRYASTISRTTCSSVRARQEFTARIQPSWSTTYSYDNDNRPKTTLLHNGRSFVNTYDGIGRITSVKLKNGSSIVNNTAITYVPGANGSKTALVSTYTNGNDSAYNYEYDANGNITSITNGSQSFTYEYDSANQLVRENL